jgi:hypothetical protein
LTLAVRSLDAESVPTDNVRLGDKVLSSVIEAVPSEVVSEGETDGVLLGVRVRGGVIVGPGDRDMVPADGLTVSVADDEILAEAVASSVAETEIVTDVVLVNDNVAVESAVAVPRVDETVSVVVSSRANVRVGCESDRDAEKSRVHDPVPDTLAVPTVRDGAVTVLLPVVSSESVAVSVPLVEAVSEVVAESSGVPEADALPRPRTDKVDDRVAVASAVTDRESVTAVDMDTVASALSRLRLRDLLAVRVRPGVMVGGGVLVGGLESLRVAEAVALSAVAVRSGVCDREADPSCVVLREASLRVLLAVRSTEGELVRLF